MTPEDPRGAEAAAAIARLEEALARLGVDKEPPAGWEDRVLGTLEEEEK